MLPNGLSHMSKMAAMFIYVQNITETLLSGTRRPMILRFGTSKMYFKYPVVSAAVRFKAVVLLLLTFCLLLFPKWESVIVLCFVVRYFMTILVLKSS